MNHVCFSFNNEFDKEKPTVIKQIEGLRTV